MQGRALTAAAPRVFWCLWFAWLIVRVLLASSLELFGDEAFYVWESRHPAAAYSDLPGMTAWLIAAGSAALGDHALAVRAPFIVMSALIPLVILRMSRRWLAHDRAWWAASLAMLLPLSAGMGALAMPDVPLLLFSLLAVDAFDRALATGSLRNWLATGLWVALGLNTHYRFLLPIAGAALLLLFAARGRAAWRQSGLWLAFFLAALGLVPQLSFHFDTAAAGPLFQFVDRHPWSWQWQGLLHVPLQALVTTPLLYLGLWLALLACVRRAPGGVPRDIVLAFAGLPTLVYLMAALVADNQRTHVHWPLLGYMPLLPALVAWWSETTNRRIVRGRPALAAVTLALAFAGCLAAFAYLATATRTSWAMALAQHKAFPVNFTGWGAAADQAWRHLDDPRFDGAALLADNFMLGAQLEFELGGAWPVFVLDHPRNRRHGRAVQLALWERDEVAWRARKGSHALLVVEESSVSLRELPDRYHDLCRRLGDMAVLGERSLYGGRRRFLYFEVRPELGRCGLPALAYIDLDEGHVASPAAGLDFSGWAFKDGVGVREVRVLLDGEDVGRAEYGLPFPGVRAQWPVSNDPGHPDVGFRVSLDLTDRAPGRHRLGLRVIGRDGSVRDVPEQWLRIAAP